MLKIKLQPRAGVIISETLCRSSEEGLNAQYTYLRHADHGRVKLLTLFEVLWVRSWGEPEAETQSTTFSVLDDDLVQCCGQPFRERDAICVPQRCVSVVGVDDTKCRVVQDGRLCEVFRYGIVGHRFHSVLVVL